MPKVIIFWNKEKYESCSLQDAISYFKENKSEYDSEFETAGEMNDLPEDEQRRFDIGMLLFESEDPEFNDISIEVDTKTLKRWEAAKYLNEIVQRGMKEMWDKLQRK